MPREVEVKHNDERGKVIYTIYEKPEDVPGRIARIWDAVEGDYVQADNGWLVPLLRKRILTSTTVLSATGKRRKRRTPIVFWEFIFPKMKWVCRPEQARTKSFNYQPATAHQIAGREARDRASELSLKRLLFCNYLLAGVDPRIAALLVWPESRNPSRIAKLLLLQPKIINYLVTQINKRMNMNDMLDTKGMTDETVVDELIGMARGEDAANKRWALGKILDIKAQKKAAQPSDPVNTPSAQSEEEKQRLQQQMREKYGDKYLGEAKPIR